MTIADLPPRTDYVIVEPYSAASGQAGRDLLDRAVEAFRLSRPPSWLVEGMIGSSPDEPIVSGSLSILYSVGVQLTFVGDLPGYHFPEDTD